MLEFILKYWIEVLFGAVIAVGGFCIKRALKSFRMEREDEKQAFLSGVKAEIRAEFERSNKKETELQEELKNLRNGLLSVQGRTFKNDCRNLLDPNHVITLEEYEEISQDHNAYKSLGGNHNGDELFNLVRQKVGETWACGN